MRDTVARKRVTEGPLEPPEAEVEARLGSKGWYTRGYLPHYDKPGALQMITFRLADAMPAVRRHEWEALLHIKDEREQRTKLEAYLDLGHGKCALRNHGAAAAVERVLRRFDGERYRLAAWVIMPNHVHALVELWTMPLGALLKAWKGASAHAVNLALGGGGTLWQREYWDRYIRDEEHFRKACRYIESNPVKTGLARLAAEWPFSSANPKWRWDGPSRYYGAQLVKGKTKGAGSAAGRLADAVQLLAAGHVEDALGADGATKEHFGGVLGGGGIDGCVGGAESDHFSRPAARSRSKNTPGLSTSSP